MKKSVFLVCLGLLGLLSVVGWQLFELQFLSLPFEGHKAAQPATIRSTAFAFSPAQQLSAGGNARYLDTHDYAADETFVPAPTKYVRLEFLASVVERPFQIFFFSDRPFPVNSFRFEFDVPVSPAITGHVLHDAQKLSCTTGSGDMAIRNDLFDVRYRDEDNIVHRCVISKKDGCAFLKRSRIYLQLFAHPSRETISEMVDLERRAACNQTLLDWGT